MKQIIIYSTFTEPLLCSMAIQMPILWEGSQTKHKYIQKRMKMIKKKY